MPLIGGATASDLEARCRPPITETEFSGTVSPPRAGPRSRPWLSDWPTGSRLRPARPLNRFCA